MRFERGQDPKGSMSIGSRANADTVVEMYMYGMAIMPSGSRPDIQLMIKDPITIHNILLNISQDKGIEKVDIILNRYMRRIDASTDRLLKIYMTGAFRLTNPTIFLETNAENEYRMPRTLRHYNGDWLRYADFVYKMPKDIDRYVRFAADDFDWCKVR